jgi:hypothetical protein
MVVMPGVIVQMVLGARKGPAAAGFPEVRIAQVAQEVRRGTPAAMLMALLTAPVMQSVPVLQVADLTPPCCATMNSSA